MEGRGDGQHDGALGALALGDGDRPLDRRLVAGHHDLGAAVVVRRRRRPRLAPPRGRPRAAASNSSPSSAAMAPCADRHGVLHGIAADAQEPRRVGDRQAAGGGERGIFAERMAGDEGGVALRGRARPRPRARGWRRGSPPSGPAGHWPSGSAPRPGPPTSAPRASATGPRRPRRRRPGPAEKPRPGPCPCRPPGCPAPERSNARVIASNLFPAGRGTGIGGPRCVNGRPSSGALATVAGLASVKEPLSAFPLAEKGAAPWLA